MRGAVNEIEAAWAIGTNLIADLAAVAAVAEDRVHAPGPVRLGGDDLVARQHAHVHPVPLLEPREPRQEPQAREGREGGDADHLAACRQPNLPHDHVDAPQPGSQGLQQRQARGREANAARVALQDPRADLVLQRLDLPADSRLRQVQFLRGQAEVERARHRLGRPYRTDGQGTVTQRARGRGAHSGCA